MLCQLAEGAFEDAEAQLELLTLMHGNISGPDFAYLQALLIKVRVFALSDRLFLHLVTNRESSHIRAGKAEEVERRMSTWQPC